MIDLAQVSLALRGATSRSLIILDEFGKGKSLPKAQVDGAGTTSADGAGLLTGVIEHLIEGVRPRTVILTHFQYVPSREKR
jgi:DNA mismatch repair protein MSH5